MKLFKKENSTVDERIENIKNKIYKEAFILVMIICFISIVVKYFIYGIKIEFVIGELLCMFIPSIYYLIKTVFCGIYSEEIEMQDRTTKVPRSIKTIIGAIVAGVCIAVPMGIRSAILYGHTTGVRIRYFIIVAITCLIIYIPILLVITILPHIVANNVSKKQSSKKDN